jgi:hypothetical protein
VSHFAVHQILIRGAGRLAAEVGGAAAEEAAIHYRTDEI